MTSTAKKILDDALALPEEDREALVEVLMTSLRYDSPKEVEQAWLEEVQRRIERLERGETVAIEWSEAKRRLREKYGIQ